LSIGHKLAVAGIATLPALKAVRTFRENAGAPAPMNVTSARTACNATRRTISMT
jgi:hypothetical protein